MPEELMELEAPPLEQAEEHLEPTEGEQAAEGQEGEQQAAGHEPVTSLFQPDGKRLDPTVRGALDKIKAENPDVGKILTKSIFRLAELDREFPGGLTDVRELRDKVEELGGITGIEQKIEGATELQELAVQFDAGNPAFVDDMVASNPESFAALAPVVFAKFAELQPESYAAYVGRVVYSDFTRNGLPLMLQRLADFIPADNPKAAELYNSIWGYLEGFKALADKPMATARPRQEQRQPDASAQREEQLRAREWKVERDSVQRSIVREAETSTLAGRKPNNEEGAQIRELFLIRSKSTADKLFPGWGDKSQRFIKNGDKAGYIRYMTAIYRRVVPEAMASAVNSTLRGSRKPAATTNGAQPKKPVAAGAAQQANGDWKPVSAEPGTWDIDMNRTNTAMLQQNRAILRDGRRVSWRA